MPLILRPRHGAASSVDLTGVVPDRLAPLGAGDVPRVGIVADGRPAELGECFTVEGDAADGELVCDGDFSAVHGVGAGMAAGHIRVHGSVGRLAAAGMSGGSVEIDGHADDWLAVGMAGGEVRVRGDAGDEVAAAVPGASVGVTGGLVIVDGRAGRRAAARMRRGIVAVGGDCGAGAAIELRAGTLLVFGRLEAEIGVGMRRGSIVAAGRVEDPGPWFLPGAAWEPPALRLLGRRLAAAGFAPSGRPDPTLLDGPWRQWHGDSLAGAKGEFFRRDAR